MRFLIKLVLMKALTSFYFLLSLALLGCNNEQKQSLEEKQKELGTGSLNERNVYTAKEIGWTAVLPENWKILTKRENFAINEKGKKAMEETYGKKVDDSKLVDLISIEKDKFNSFQSTMEPFDNATDGDYDDHNIAIHDLIKDVYKTKGIPADHELGAVRIDGIMFDRFITKIYSPDKKKVILEQRMFSALINGYDFSMNINFNDSTNEQILMKVINSSKFSIKK